MKSRDEIRAAARSVLNSMRAMDYGRENGLSMEESVFNAGVALSALSWALDEDYGGLGLDRSFGRVLDSLITLEERMGEDGERF